ncbi:hypothetical protein [Polaromonas sp. YR568]|uniref:hypothetical protein n=1 Tax=Polaromonas sp. YR568 TaxID=1855301 RepID=UPI0031382083
MTLAFLSRPLMLLAALAATSHVAAQMAPYPQVDPQPALQAADPATPVPATLYRSVFRDLPSGVEQDSVDWKKANADVGQFRRGHVDLLKWEQANSRNPAAVPAAPTATPAAPAPAPTR